MRPVDDTLKAQLEKKITKIEEILASDFLTIIGSILPGIEVRLKTAIEHSKEKRDRISVLLETDGGVVEVVERMVETIRHHYKEVNFIVLNKAMSAGTVFVMSGDRIIMDYFACLGPIDPQIVRDGKLVPALSYLNKFEELNKKAADGNLTTAEYALLNKLDLGELDQYEQAKELSRELLVKWLSKYKFNSWKYTETNHKKVTIRLKKFRANSIATKLGDNQRWHSHGRGINKKSLTSELKLRIEDLTDYDNLNEYLNEYFELLTDYMYREKINSFIHTKEYF